LEEYVGGERRGERKKKGEGKADSLKLEFVRRYEGTQKEGWVSGQANVVVCKGPVERERQERKDS